MNTEQRTVLLIYPKGVSEPAPGLSDALARAGAVCRHFFLDGDCGPLLDALEESVIPVVMKGWVAATALHQVG